MNSLEMSSAEFRLVAKEVTRLCAEYLDELDSRRIFPGTQGAQADDFFRTPAPEDGIGINAIAELQNVIDHCRAQNGRFFGYVLGSGEPVGAAVLGAQPERDGLALLTSSGKPGVHGSDMVGRCDRPQ